MINGKPNDKSKIVVFVSSVVIPCLSRPSRPSYYVSILFQIPYSRVHLKYVLIEFIIYFY